MKTTSPLKISPATSASSLNSNHPAILIDGAGKTYGDVEAVRPIWLTIQPRRNGGAARAERQRQNHAAVHDRRRAGALRGVHPPARPKNLAGLHPGRELSREVGMIHQQYDLVPNLSSLQNVLAGRLGDWGLFKSVISLVWPQDRQVGMTALEQVGVRRPRPGPRRLPLRRRTATGSRGASPGAGSRHHRRRRTRLIPGPGSGRRGDGYSEQSPPARPAKPWWPRCIPPT